MNPLDTLLGAYLHDDWPVEYPDVWAAVGAFVTENSSEITNGAHAQVSKLLQQGMTETQLLQVLDEFGCGYYPPGDNTTATEFLTRLEVELRPDNPTPGLRHVDRSAAITQHRAQVRRADIAEARAEPGLRGLLSGYLYFGWVDDYDSSWDAVADFVVTADDHEVRLAHDELVNLLARSLADVDLDAAVNDDFRSGYIPESEGLTLRQFLAQLELELRPSAPA